jgi:hypothetical protein
MSSGTVADLLIALAILSYVVYNQLRARPARTNMRLPLILTIIGGVELVEYLHKGHHGATVVAALLGSLVLAAILGAIRALTVRVWVEGGQPWRQGNWLTAVLWLVSLGLHFGYDYLVDGKGPNAGLGTASALLYLAVTYAIQRLIVQARADRLRGVGPLDTSTGPVSP